MNYKRSWILAILIIAALLLSACGQRLAAAEKIQPAVVESVEKSEFNRVKLTERAAERLGIQTARVLEEPVNGEQRLVLPYAAILYGLNGETWVYTNGEPLTYVRAAITVDYIDDDRVVLSDGPPAGTHVVTVGVAQLFGAETGVGK